jgi:hypothetical protein
MFIPIYYSDGLYDASAHDMLSITTGVVDVYVHHIYMVKRIDVKHVVTSIL